MRDARYAWVDIWTRHRCRLQELREKLSQEFETFPGTSIKMAGIRLFLVTRDDVRSLSTMVTRMGGVYISVPWSSAFCLGGWVVYFFLFVFLGC